MIHPFRTKLLAAVVALALPGAVLAQQQGQQDQKQGRKQAQQQGQAQQNLGQIRASDLKDMTVVDAQGKEIGEIAEVVVDMQSGRLHAAVLEFGGVMGVGEKQYAFSPKELRPGNRREQLVLNIDKQKLENREGFAKNQWPAMGDDYWGRVGGKANAGKGTQNLMRISEVVGKEVQDNQGQDVGEVREVILDLRGGRIRNVVLDVTDGGRATVQPKALSLGTDDKLVTSISREQLRGAKGDAARGGTGNN
jgi:sporulation protein YlmC with PRC-barrel domain